MELALAGALTTLAGCSGDGRNFLSPSGPIAAAEYHSLWLVTAIVLVVVIPVIIGVPLIAWRYRAGNHRARYAPDWDFSWALEWPMWLVPAAVVAVLSVLLWKDTHKLDPYRPLSSRAAPIEVDVVGLDWKWLFIYPRYHIATVGELAFPKDRPVSLRLTSDTVMQSFMIPALAGQIYAMPGMVTRLNIAATDTGHFVGMNTQYNGSGFHAQRFDAVAMRSAAFGRWVRAVRRGGVPLGTGPYRVLGRDSTPAQLHTELGDSAMPAGVTYFSKVAPGIFRRIVQRYHGGSAVGADRQPGTAVYGTENGDHRGQLK